MKKSHLLSISFVLLLLLSAASYLFLLGQSQGSEMGAQSMEMVQNSVDHLNTAGRILENIATGLQRLIAQ